MSYCKRMKRSCICGRLSVYDRSGRLVEPTDGTGCLTNEEVNSALSLLLQEWQTRYRNDRSLAPLSLPMQ